MVLSGVYGLMVLCFEGLDKFGKRSRTEGLRARPAAADSAGF